MGVRIRPETIAEANESLRRNHERDLDALGEKLARRGLGIETIVRLASEFSVAIPSWGLSAGGTRFGRFARSEEPETVEEKLLYASRVNDVTGITSRVSLHFPWDTFEDAKPLRRLAKDLRLSFDAVNSNTFQDQPGQECSYRYGSLSATDAGVRDCAVEHNLDCIARGKTLGSRGLVVWLADGSSFPGQIHFRDALERTLESLRRIYEGLPRDWRLYIEYKPFEPAFYGTVIPDWGTSYLLAEKLGEQAACLVDLGHHLPNTNVEQVVATLLWAGRLGGFHFNDSKYADDDVSAGSIRPYQLFLIYNELVDAARDGRTSGGRRKSRLAYMIDQSHNVKDPLEDLAGSAMEIHRAFVRALLVDRKALKAYQEENDVVMAERTLKGAFEMDVSPILAEVRLRKGAALDPIQALRKGKGSTA